MPTILEQLKSGVPIKFDKLQKLMPTGFADTVSGTLGLFPTTAKYFIKEYWLKTGKEIIPTNETPLKTSYEVKSAWDIYPEIGHDIYLNSTGDDMSVRFGWIEVSGALIHPISVEGITYKQKQVWDGCIMMPGTSIVVKGIVRSATSTPSGTYKFPDYTEVEFDKHTLQTIMFYKYTLYGGADELGFSYANPPQPSDFDTIKKYIGSGNKGYVTGFGLVKYRL
jgi:hypothetical protein